jgi:DNA polymerase
MLVGEAPGENEDKTGLPFVGRSGALLTSMLDEAGLSRKDTYITSVCKCRPPSNRNPKADEVSACLPYLDRQIALIKPKIIVCLGLVAAKALIDPKAKLSDVRGKVHKYDNVPCIVTYHPAAVLRFPKNKAMFISDIKTMVIKAIS